MLPMIKKMYRALVPAPVKKSRLAAWIKTQLVPHDWMYDASYYATDVEPPARRSAGTIADTIMEDLRVRSVVDVGCGTGALLEALRDRGCEVWGLEGSEVALEYCRARRLRVTKFDLERDTLTDHPTYDAAVSMEVGEHLPQGAADRLVQCLTRLSDVVIFTAAPPGQAGLSHVNMQPPSYWIAKFRKRGYEHAAEMSDRWRERWKAAGDVELCYHRNLMILRRAR